MAPDYYKQMFLQGDTSAAESTYYTWANEYIQEPTVEESDKQRLDRLSREKMQESWKFYDLKRSNIKEIRTIVKPYFKLHSHKRI